MEIRRRHSRYDDARTEDDPVRAVLDFFRSAYDADSKRAGWDRGQFACFGG